MKEVLLVLLGAFISCGTTWLLDWLKFCREERVHVMRNRETTYIELLEYITHTNANKKLMIERREFPDTEKAKYNNILVKCKLYATEKIANDFYTLMGIIIQDINSGEYTNTKAMYDNLFIEVRKELDIKD